MAGFSSLWHREGVRQLIKFCIVGFSSTVVDTAVKWVLLHSFPAVPWWVVATIAFGFGLTNGFFWNRHLTFRAHEHGKAHTQYIKFAISNGVGLLLNLTISKMFLILLTGKIAYSQNPAAEKVIYAGWMALPFVAIWNFSAAKYWTFRAPKEAPPPASAASALGNEVTE